MALVMTVVPGKGGQSFMVDMMESLGLVTFSTFSKDSLVFFYRFLRFLRCFLGSRLPLLSWGFGRCC